MRLYVAGPMSGKKSFNFPAFDAAAKTLKAAGYEVVSPAEIDDPETRAACLASATGDLEDIPPGESYGAFLGRDISIVIDDVDGVVVLPGWSNSRGARIEVFTAVQMGKPIYSRLAHTPWVRPLTLEELNQGLGGGFGVDVIEKIVAKKSQLEMDGRLSKEILVGEAAAKELGGLLKRKDGSLREVRLDVPRAKQTTVFGLPVTLAPWLPRDEVLVVGSKRASTEERRTTAGEVRTTSVTGGEKGVKPERLDLIPPQPLEELGRVYGAGAKKYSDTNYLKAYEYRKSAGAMLRHITRWLDGEDRDPETGCHHLAHAAWHCFTLQVFQASGLGTDDRLFHEIAAQAERQA